MVVIMVVIRAFIGLAVDGTPPVRNVTALDLPIRYFRAVRVISVSVRSYGSVEERSVHTGKVAGSIPARTTDWENPRSRMAWGFFMFSHVMIHIRLCT